MLYREITDKILRAYFTVYNELGYGFAEKIYENAMYKEMTLLGLDCSRQFPIKVFYKGEIVGEYFADILVNNCVIVELKACDTLHENHEHQLMNYLKATDAEVGLLLNFGRKAEFKRKVFSNSEK
jgi:GxxExxY protein